MARFSLNKLPKKERIRLIGEFYTAMSLIKNRDEAAKVFKNILEPDEIGNIMRRIDVAVLLYLGISYDDIVDLLGVGKNKISAVHKKLEKDEDGYKILIERMLEQRKKRKVQLIKRAIQAERRLGGSEIERLKKRYQGLFLFENILDELGDYLDAKAQIKSDEEEMREHHASTYRNRRDS